MVAPVEKVFGIIEPPGEYVGEQRHRFFGQFGAPIRPWHLVDSGLNADLRETLLHQNADRLVDAGKAEIERELDWLLNSIAIAGFAKELLRPGEVGVKFVRLRPGNVDRLI